MPLVPVEEWEDTKLVCSMAGFVDRARVDACGAP